MQTLLIILVILVAVLLAVGTFVLLHLRRGTSGSATEESAGLQLLLAQINELSRTVDQKMGESQKEVNETIRFQTTQSQGLIRDITEKLTRLDETNRQVVGFTEQLRSLQDILKNPKQRGVLGEYYLETLLKNVLPAGSYQMQYAFEDGTIVDAAVFVKDKIIPIDSKFSLENYNRLVESAEGADRDRHEKAFVGDLKNRIAETSKYIQPENNTMDFAFMFIPHEAIYYDLIVNKIGASENLIQTAAGKHKVIVVSPTSFLAYLQTVLQGLKAMQIEESAKDIVKRVEELGKHLKAYEEYHHKLGNALGTAVNQYNFSSKEIRKVDKDVLRITGEAPGIEGLALDKPSVDE